MKNSVAIVFVIACIFALYTETYGKPSDMDTTAREAKDAVKDSVETTGKNIKDTAKNVKDGKKKKDCMKECSVDYDPICAHDPTNVNFKPRTFGSQCAMEIFNCEMGSNLTVKTKRECPGGVGGAKPYVG